MTEIDEVEANVAADKALMWRLQRGWLSAYVEADVAPSKRLAWRLHGGCADVATGVAPAWQIKY